MPRPRDASISFNMSRRDARAYAFLTAMAVLCTVFGLLASRDRARLRSYELAYCYELLYTCSDAAYEYLETEDGRAAQAVRLANAAAQLSCGEELRSRLLAVTEAMREGEGDIALVRALSDAFAMLAALDYPDAEAAWQLINETLERLLPDSADATATAESIPDAQLRTARAEAERTVEAILGGLLRVADMGECFTAGNDNVYMTFSPIDGALTSFIYLRLGDIPEQRLSGEALVYSAATFAERQLRGRGELSIDESSELCGFTTVSLSRGEERCRVTVDSYGRVWRFERLDELVPDKSKR